MEVIISNAQVVLAQLGVDLNARGLRFIADEFIGGENIVVVGFQIVQIHDFLPLETRLIMWFP